MEGLVTILLITVDSKTQSLLQNLLIEEGRHDFNISTVSSVKQAIELCQSEQFACIIVDDALLIQSGLSELKSLRVSTHHFFNAIIVITDELTDEKISEAIKNGADDYIARAQLSTNKLSHIINKVVMRSAFIRDIEAQKQTLAHLAHHDALTDLPNRLQFEEMLTREVARCRRHDQQMCLLFIDIDNFKKINDSMGHAIGDQLLYHIARRLKNCLRVNDFIARIGGDEFAVITTNVHQVHHAGVVARKIMNVLKKPHVIENYEINATASIGVAVYPQSGIDDQTLLRNADLAMYQAKQNGKNHYQYHEESLNIQHQKRLILENELRFSIERQQLRLVYQPKYNLLNRKVAGLETLLRWHHPELGTVKPSEFIPIAEQTGLIVPIGEWVMQTAIKEYARYKHQYNLFSDLKLSFNVSPKQLVQGHLVKLLTKLTNQEKIAMELIELELTEMAVMKHSKALLNTLNKLSNKGVSLIIDDFGTGYSSLSHLKLLPISGLKIDLSFISGITYDETDATIVKAIVNLANSLHLSVCAEGIENQAQLDFLNKIKCQMGQGYVFARPDDLDEVVEGMIEGAYNKSIV